MPQISLNLDLHSVDFETRTFSAQLAEQAQHLKEQIELEENAHDRLQRQLTSVNAALQVQLTVQACRCNVLSYKRSLCAWWAVCMPHVDMCATAVRNAAFMQGMEDEARALAARSTEQRTRNRDMRRCFKQDQRLMRHALQVSNMSSGWVSFCNCSKSRSLVCWQYYNHGKLGV